MISLHKGVFVLCQKMFCTPVCYKGHCTVVGQCGIDLREDKFSLGVPIMTPTSKKQRRSLILVDVLQLLFKKADIVLLYK